MTCEPIDSERWRLTLAEMEAVIIINILAQLGRHYQQDISQMSPALRAYWQGTISRNGQDDAEESQEMLTEARAELRSERLALVENWIREFELAESRAPWTVEINASERDELVAMLNDRRLTLAHEMGINEAIMEKELDEIEEERLQQTVWEIDMLGHVILIILGPQIHRP